MAARPRGLASIHPRAHPARRRAALAAGALAVCLAGAAFAQELPPLGGAPEAAEPAGELAPPGSVEPTASPEQDRAVAERLRQIFGAVEGLEGIGVSVTAGVVRLSGEVLSKDAGERAARIARQLRGVVEVQSDVEVVQDVDRRLGGALERLRDRAVALVGRLPLFGVALAVLALFVGLARLTTAWDVPYRRLARNGFARDLLRQAVRIGIVGAGIVIALQLLDATAIVAAAAGLAGLAGLAVSFAFRDLVENYIASVLLSVRQPFLPQDHVIIEGYEGRVARLTSRATVLIDFAGNHVRIPNAMVFKSVIQNFTRNPVRRFDFTVGVAADTDLGDAISLGIRTLCRMPGTVDEPPPQGWIDELGDWNVVLHFFAWIDQANADWFRTRSEGIRVVKEAFDTAGIEMPEPGLRLGGAPARGEERGAAPARRPAPGAEAEPELEFDISPDPHLLRTVAAGRAAAGGDDLLDPSAPRE